MPSAILKQRYGLIWLFSWGYLVSKKECECSLTNAGREAAFASMKVPAKLLPRDMYLVTKC